MNPVRSEVKEYIRADVAVIYDGRIHGPAMYDASKETDTTVIRVMNQPLVPLLRKLKTDTTVIRVMNQPLVPLLRKLKFHGTR